MLQSRIESMVPCGRHEHVQNKCRCSLGEWTFVCSCRCDGLANLSSVEVYNPRTNQWGSLSSCMGIGRSYSGFVLLIKNKEVYEHFKVKVYTWMLISGRHFSYVWPVSLTD